MTKRKIVEVVEEYSDVGKLIRKTTTETTEDDDTNYYPNYSQPWWGIYPPTGPNQPSVTWQVGDPYPCEGGSVASSVSSASTMH